MQRRLLTVILFALIAALAASTVLYKAINSASAKPVPVATVPILVAAHDLSAGEFVGDGDIKQIQWAGAVSPQWIKNREEIAGRGLISGVNKGEPFPESRLALKGAGSGLASRIPPGMRVMAVHVDEQSGLSKIILPGTHVDVLSTAPMPGSSSQEQVARMILQNVEVLSTDQSVEHIEKEKTGAIQSANILVTPRQAELLSQAVAHAKVQLAIRNPLDKSSVAETVAADHLKRPLHVAAKPAPAAEKALPVVQPKPEHTTVEVVHGTKRAVTEVGAVARQESTNE